MNLKNDFLLLKQKMENTLKNEKESMRIAKAKRKEKRIKAEKVLTQTDLDNLKKQLADCMSSETSGPEA